MEHHCKSGNTIWEKSDASTRQYDKFADFFCKLLDISQNIERDLPHAARPNNKLSSWDRLIFSLLNKNQITEKSFTKELNFLHLKKEASRLIVTEFEKRMKKTIMHKELGKKVSYQYLIRLEAYKLIKHLIGEKEYEGFRIWW